MVVYEISRNRILHSDVKHVNSYQTLYFPYIFVLEINGYLEIKAKNSVSIENKALS